jgi:hypothetical protein
MTKQEKIILCCVYGLSIVSVLISYFLRKAQQDPMDLDILVQRIFFYAGTFLGLLGFAAHSYLMRKIDADK